MSRDRLHGHGCREGAKIVIQQMLRDIFRRNGGRAVAADSPHEAFTGVLAEKTLLELERFGFAVVRESDLRKGILR